MNPFTYSLLLYLLSPLIWGYLLYRAIKAPEYRDGFWQRLGFQSRLNDKEVILVHCASVGETLAAVPLIKQLIERYADKQIVISTTTPTGKKTVLDKFQNQVRHVYLPVDWPGSVNRFLKRLKPGLVILMETELWFNLLKQCQQKQIPVLLANARLSDKSLAKYQKYPVMSQQLFDFVDEIAAQFESDKTNYLALGVCKKQVSVVGSIKFDIQLQPEMLTKQSQLKQQWAEHRPAWIAVSIHPGEFEEILRAHRQLLKIFPELLLIAVPRHPEKFAEFCEQCEKHQFSYARRTVEEHPGASHQVMVGDTMGEMLLFCGAADVAFVGGSLIERGGHNPLEPLACGLPVYMGTSYYNFADICESLRQEKFLQITENESTLVDAIKTRLSDRQQLALFRQKADSFMLSNRGTVDKMLVIAERLLQRN